jgi:hypothetical protein
MMSDLDNEVDEDSDSGNSEYEFSTPERLRLTRKGDLSCHMMLKGICKMIDGVNLMCTSYFKMYMLLLLALLKDPSIVAPAENMCQRIWLWSLSFQIMESRH